MLHPVFHSHKAGRDGRMLAMKASSRGDIRTGTCPGQGVLQWSRPSTETNKIPRTPATFRNCFPSLYQGTCVNTEHRVRAQPVWFKVWLCPQKQSGNTSFLPALSLAFTTHKKQGSACCLRPLRGPNPTGHPSRC